MIETALIKVIFSVKQRKEIVTEKLCTVQEDRTTQYYITHYGKQLVLKMNGDASINVLPEYSLN